MQCIHFAKKGGSADIIKQISHKFIPENCRSSTAAMKYHSVLALYLKTYWNNLQLEKAITKHTKLALGSTDRWASLSEDLNFTRLFVCIVPSSFSFLIEFIVDGWELNFSERKDWLFYQIGVTIVSDVPLSLVLIFLKDSFSDGFISQLFTFIYFSSCFKKLFQHLTKIKRVEYMYLLYLIS